MDVETLTQLLREAEEHQAHAETKLGPTREGTRVSDGRDLGAGAARSPSDQQSAVPRAINR